MKLRLAFAVNSFHNMEQTHFGEADQFLVFDLEQGTWTEQGALENPVRGGHHHHEHHHSHDHGHEGGHGHGGKAIAITAFLKENGVQAVVSAQYGPNVRRIAEHVIPVLHHAASMDTAKQELQAFAPEIQALWESRPALFPILRIREGELREIEVKQP